MALRGFVLSLLVCAATCGGSPTAPSETVALRSIKYSRHHPLNGAEAQPLLMLSAYRPGDARGRIDTSEVALRLDPDGSFSYPYPDNIRIPIGTQFFVQVSDQGVTGSGGSHLVAQDIFINGTLLIPTVFSNGIEQASATIDASGRVNPI